MKKQIPILNLEQLLTNKDLARAAQVHTKTVARWSRRTGVMPTWHQPAISRWTPGDALRLLNAALGRAKSKQVAQRLEAPT